MTTSYMFNLYSSIIVSSTGLIAIFYSLLRIKQKEYMLLNIGFFFFLYGLRWLLEAQQINGNFALYHSFLTYFIPVPFAGFLLNVLGKGLFKSVYWFFISTIVYAVTGVIHDILSTTGPLSPSINTIVLALWIFIGSINVVLIQEQGNTILKILKITLNFFLFCIVYDNLVIMNILPWHFRLEHIDVLVLFIGMVYISILQFRQSKVKSGQGVS